VTETPAETLTVQDRTRVRVVTLDRPDALNAFNGQMFDDLADVFLDTASDDGIRVLVLTGAGRAFTAGADLGEMGRAPGSDGGPPADPRHGLGGMLDAIIDFPKPFIVAVNGVGVGIGATIVGLADLTYMATGSRLRCPFSALGLTAEAASTYTFPRLLGHQRASWFLLSGEWMSAEECVAAGLAVECCPPEGLMGLALGRALTLADLPLESLIATKDLIVGPQREQLKAAVRAENEALARLVGGPANREAVAAFREKREPDFSDL
jgi:enoyl-CoA hydratase/carnithine racemase